MRVLVREHARAFIVRFGIKKTMNFYHNTLTSRTNMKDVQMEQSLIQSITKSIEFTT